MLHEAEKYLTADRYAGKVRIVPGGKERWQSVQSGVNALCVGMGFVHDAARPFIKPGGDRFGAWEKMRSSMP